MQENKGEKILITRLSAIGDVIHALPVAYALRKKFPDAQIDWLVEAKAYPLVKLNPYLDNVILLPRKQWREMLSHDFIGTIKSFFKFFREMKKKKYDINLDLHGLFKSALSSFLIKPGLRIGPADGRELSTFFYQAKIDIPAKKMHKIERNLHLASALEAETDEVKYGLKMTPIIRSRVSRLFESVNIDQSKKLVVINPFTTWESKNWFLERYFQLANELIKAGYYVIFTGGPGDKEAVDSFEALDKKSYSNLAGKTDLEELTEIYNRASLYIGGDTGPTHLAAAVGLKVIALMGPTDPDTHGPYGEGHTVIQDNSLECIRCWDRHCSRKMQCMKSITVEQVLRIAKQKLEV
ncbi:heptosyltransferase-1 [Halanaerobium congolense]|jgi:lipopolysaccharide heptosyltransferase I|uniref:Heptosyltransferase-1 n=1 Tax=Halanaerobium congolense TaxID=54121 RepID=A0A1I0AMC2_9FIRM|nr:glycosyltransferase family 9 protein [Halanaerobium congolense]PTX16243.1 heptosyltransferase-1 [Halanaerobium congolense]SDF46859.1 heptosyltransferase-1 [Halanaerobium congolense]SES94882.1 heptosyltransferase-1 [Halanaerobium congolense]SFP27437.1 heptosyltransferase-1 [Halanaerobium congolense]